MSLADQSQQWYPTSVQVTVLQARNLRIKGKNGTNDAYAIMQVAKEKFATSVVEKTVSPMWKEEATFDLQLFHHGNTERCTLHVNVMHRALVGPDKLLGQAVVNLLELNAIQSRSKTEWFQLLDKAGKPDKDRGEVLVDIQFMRNNMTASMFDLSATEKPRSRLGKLKDKVRGKKKEGLSDSASAVVPSFTQVLTDSEGEGEPEGDGAADKEGKKKKKHKLKSLFSTKSNLQRNVSQSMSVLGPLPERNSSLTGSRSSGLNIDSSEGKKKFKFLTHKRTGSSDSKSSQGSTSILGRSRQASTSSADQSNLCINGSHVYTEEPQPRSSRAGSTFSLASSGHGSMEDLRRYQGRKSSVDSLKAGKQPFPWEEESIGDREEQEEEGVELERERMRVEQLLRRKLLDEEQRVTEEEKKRVRELEEEDRMRRGEEKERIRREEEDKIKIKEQERQRVKEENRRIEEEEIIRKEQDQRKVLEDAEKIRLEEEERAAEERKNTLMEEEARRVRQEREEEEEKIREQERLFEEDRKKEEELLRREEEARMEQADRLRGEMEERKHDEEQRIRREEEDKSRKEEEEFALRRAEEERQRMDVEDKMRREERRRNEEEETLREERKNRDAEEKRREEDERRETEEERRRKEEEDRVREEEEARLRREEEERKIREMEEKRREEDERRKTEERRRREEEDRLKREEEHRLQVEEEERERLDMEEQMRRKEEELRKEEEERRRLEEEERVRKEVEEFKLKEEEERKIRDMEEKMRREEDEWRKTEEERRRKEVEDRLRAEEDERKTREQQRLEREMEEKRKEERDSVIRLEEERSKEEESRKFEEESRKEQEEKRRAEDQKMRGMEERERARLEDERRKEANLEKERRMREEEEGEPQEQEKIRLAVAEKRMVLQDREGEALVGKNPFEEVPSEDPFEDISTTNPFEEPSTAHSTEPLNRTTKISAVKPSSTSCLTPPKPLVSSNPFFTPSEVEGPTTPPIGHQGVKTSPDSSASLMEKKRQAPLPPDSLCMPHSSNVATARQPHAKTTKPTLTSHSAMEVVGKTDSRQSTDGVCLDRCSALQDRRPAPQPPDSLRGTPGTQSQIQKDLRSTVEMLGTNDRPGEERDASNSGASSLCAVEMIAPLKGSTTAMREESRGLQGQGFSHHRNQFIDISDIPSAIGGFRAAKKDPAPSRPDSSCQSEKMKYDENSSMEPSMEDYPSNGSPVVFEINSIAGSGRETQSHKLCDNGGSLQSHNKSSHSINEEVTLPKSLKVFHAPMPPVKMMAVSTVTLETPQNSRAPASGMAVNKQTNNTDVEQPVNIITQTQCFSHSEILEGSLGKTPESPQAMYGQGTCPQARSQPCEARSLESHSQGGEEVGGKGGKPASASRRPHPVKPLNSSEQKPVSNIQGGQPEKSDAISGSIQEKIKVQEPGVKGPYSQLTQEELISLVVKQQKQLGDRDKKIKELEQYIDNLLVRVIEEAPCILMSLNSPKP
ncbi:uncharacterized protein rab11fip1b isoform X2 [Osmerus mordax]|uniref:uncharacterized protein rab11fip1b isoform X2 n=1 Tax=Osmerus mordax TaxID=8014 RepID=UPI0035102D2F